MKNILRGLTRFIPAGNAGMHLAENIIAVIKNKKAKAVVAPSEHTWPNGDTTSVPQANQIVIPHSYTAIWSEIIAVAFVAFSVYMKWISIDDAVKYVANWLGLTPPVGA